MITFLAAPWHRESHKGKVLPYFLAFNRQSDPVDLIKLEKAPDVELASFLSYRILVNATMLTAHSKPVEKCQRLELEREI